MNHQKYQLVFLAALLGLLSGCASTLNVTYHSDPSGAVIYSDNQRIGYTPVALEYKVTDEDRKRGYMILQGTSVRWPSGAFANISSLRADLKNGSLQQFTFNRPDNYPGREADVRFALELEKINIMRRQAQAQEYQAMQQMFNAINQQYQRQRSTIRNCTSRVTALGSIDTTCY